LRGTIEVADIVFGESTAEGGFISIDAVGETTESVEHCFLSIRSQPVDSATPTTIRGFLVAAKLRRAVQVAVPDEHWAVRISAMSALEGINDLQGAPLNDVIRSTAALRTVLARSATKGLAESRAVEFARFVGGQAGFWTLTIVSARKGMQNLKVLSVSIVLRDEKNQN